MMRLDVPLLHLPARETRFDQYSRIWRERYGAMLSYLPVDILKLGNQNRGLIVGTARFSFAHTPRQYSLTSFWRSNFGRAS